MEAPTPVSVYIYAALVFLIAGGLGIWLMRKVENEEEPAETAV